MRWKWGENDIKLTCIKLKQVYINIRALYSISWGTGKISRFLKRGLVCSKRPFPLTSLTALFRTMFSGLMVDWLQAEKMLLQYSIWDLMYAFASNLRCFWSKIFFIWFKVKIALEIFLWTDFMCSLKFNLWSIKTPSSLNESLYKRLFKHDFIL